MKLAVRVCVLVISLAMTLTRDVPAQPTVAVSSPKAKAQPLTVTLRLSQVAPTAFDGEIELISLDRCGDNDDVSCLPGMMLRVEPPPDAPAGAVPLKVWLMLMDEGDRPQGVLMLPSGDAEGPHWRLPATLGKYFGVPWGQSHPPSMLVDGREFRFLVTFEQQDGRRKTVLMKGWSPSFKLLSAQ